MGKGSRHPTTRTGFREDQTKGAFRQTQLTMRSKSAWVRFEKPSHHEPSHQQHRPDDQSRPPDAPDRSTIKLRSHRHELGSGRVIVAVPNENKIVRRESTFPLPTPQRTAAILGGLRPELPLRRRNHAESDTDQPVEKRRVSVSLARECRWRSDPPTADSSFFNWPRSAVPARTSIASAAISERVRLATTLATSPASRASSLLRT